jgi:hypothetical protein
MNADWSQGNQPIVRFTMAAADDSRGSAGRTVNSPQRVGYDGFEGREGIAGTPVST